MKRQLTSILLFSALLVGGASTFVSCTDHESDSAYNTSISLADAIAKQKAELTKLNSDLEKKHDADKEALSKRIEANEKALNNGALSELGQYATLDLAIQQTKFYTKEFKDVKDDILALEKFREDYPKEAKKITDALEKKFKELDKKVSDEAEAQEKLNEAYNTAFDYLINKNLQNIAINATENPVLGYYNAAFLGSKLNLVSSFYGTAAAQNQDWDITKGEFLNNGDAGKIYITLNPNEIDPECITDLKLVDSQGNEAKGFKLGDIQTTDKVLTYGFTKAASANGFYEVPVLATDPANDDFSLNKGELKEAAKNVLAKLKNPKESNLNLSQIATTLYRSVNNQLKAYTVKASYVLYDPTQPVEKRFVVKSQVAPTYDMAAFAVKPLSYNTLKGNQSLKNLGLALDKYMLPTLSDKIGKYTDALDFQIKYEGNKQIEVASLLATKNLRCWENPEKKEVYICDKYGNVQRTVSNASLETYVINNNHYEGGQDWFYSESNIEWKLIENGWFDGTGWHHNSYTTWNFADDEVLYVIKTTDNTIEKLLSSLNEQISTELSPIKDAITNAAAKWDNAITPVNNLLHKINAKIGNVNELLQPTMLYKSSKTDDWNTLSTLGGRLGTRMTGTGSTVLVATSWTGELLAPAYKKSVYVKGNPAGAKVTLMDGTTPAKKIAGSTQKVLFSATATGNYTIVYEAVDYSGVSVKKEYHITVE
jgi:lipoprotein